MKFSVNIRPLDIAASSNVVGGTTGYVAYDAVKYIEDIPFFDSPSNDIHLFTFRFIIVIDRLKNRKSISFIITLI